MYTQLQSAKWDLFQKTVIGVNVFMVKNSKTISSGHILRHWALKGSQQCLVNLHTQGKTTNLCYK